MTPSLMNILKDNTLTGDNFVTWKRKIVLLLQAEKHKFVLSTSKPLAPTSESKIHMVGKVAIVKTRQKVKEQHMKKKLGPTKKVTKIEGHINLNRIKRLVSDGPLSDLKVDDLPTCESCLEGKMTKTSFTTKVTRGTECLGLIYTDVCRPMSIQARGGYEYFITFTDDNSRFGYVYLIKHKSDAFDMFKAFKAEVENQHEKHKKILRSDLVREYLSGESQENLSDDDDPYTYKEAMEDFDCRHWQKAMQFEIESMFNNKVWYLVDFLKGLKPIGCKWVYKRKRRMDGKVETFKARLVAKGYT
ncbi:hypothetical protein QYF36_015955 [Acer negundo]|nr:hypothetical protein QYF36_015955 [Acer negundo]